MSEEKVLEITPIVDIDTTEDMVLVQKGVHRRTIMNIPSQPVNNTAVMWQNVSPSSLSIVVDRNWRVSYQLTATVTFPVTGTLLGNYPICNAIVGPLGITRLFPAGAVAYVPGAAAVDPTLSGVDGIGYTFCLRDNPLQSCMSTLEIKINDGATNVTSNEIVPMTPYLLKDEDYQFFEMPVKPDNSAKYVATAVNDNNNPFCNARQNDKTRGTTRATLVYEAVASAIVTRVYTFDCVEELLISPLVYGKSFDDRGFANIYKIAINARILDIQHSLSKASGLLAGSNVLMSLAPITVPGSWGKSTADLLLGYVTVDPLISCNQPAELKYNWTDITMDQNEMGINYQAGGTIKNTSLDSTFSSTAMTLTNIPNRIVSCLKPSVSQYIGAASQEITNTFLRIKSIALTFGTKQNIFAEYSEADLWRMSCKNGLNMDFNTWRTVGSILIIDVASDIGLESDQQAGDATTTQLKITGSYSCSPLAVSNQTTELKYTVLTLYLTDSECIITPSNCSFKTIQVSSEETIALTTMQDNKIDAAGFRKLKSRGGSMFGSIGKLVHKGLKHLVDNPDHVKSGLEFAQSGLKSLGVGGSMSAGSVVGGKMRRHKRVC